MSDNARFHSKYHRRNHHTIPTDGYPDSGSDPIASYAEPFQGDFYLNGNLIVQGALTNYSTLTSNANIYIPVPNLSAGLGLIPNKSLIVQLSGQDYAIPVTLLGNHGNTSPILTNNLSTFPTYFNNIYASSVTSLSSHLVLSAKDPTNGAVRASLTNLRTVGTINGFHVTNLDQQVCDLALTTSQQVSSFNVRYEARPYHTANSTPLIPGINNEELQVYYYDPSNPLVKARFGNKVIVIGENNELVGIGVTNPQYKLDVSGTINTTGGNSDQWNSSYTSWSTSSATSIVGFNDSRYVNLSSQAFLLVNSVSSIKPVFGNNNVTGNNSAILGGMNNNITGNNTFILGSNISSSLTGYTLVNNLSSQGTIYDSIGNSNNWNASTTAVINNSGSWNGGNVAYTNLLANSGNNLASYTVIAANSGNYNSAFQSVNSLSGGWVGGNSAYTNLLANSGNYNSAFQSVNNLSGGWVGGNSAYTYLQNTSAFFTNTSNTVVSNSANWNYSQTVNSYVSGTSATNNYKFNKSIFAPLSTNAYVLNPSLSSSIPTNSTASAVYGIHSAVLGGNANIINNDYSVIGGGGDNTASGCYATIGGGSCNIVNGTGAFIGGGFGNCSCGSGATITGGGYNCVTGNHSVINSGCCNIISGNCSGILGGSNNILQTDNSYILGSNITATTPNTTYVENINASTTLQGSNICGAFLSIKDHNVGYYPVLSNLRGQFLTNSNSFAQINHQNTNNGGFASTDIVVTSDIGDDNNYYLDIGINSSNYYVPAYSITSSNDAYIYSQSSNLVMGTASQKDIIFHTGGTSLTNEAMRIIGNDGITIGTQTANRTFTVNGDIINTGSITAQGTISTSNGSSILWNNINTVVTTVSSRWDTLIYNTVVTAPITATPPIGVYYDGTRAIYRFKQNELGNNSITLSGFRLPSNITLTFSTLSGITDVVNVVYNALDSSWDIISFLPGYNQ